MSGSHGLRSRLADLGVHPTDEEFTRIFDAFKDVADAKDEVDDRDLMAILGEQTQIKVEDAWTLDLVQVSGGDHADRDAGRNESLERASRAGNELRLVPLVRLVPESRRTLDEVGGDAERRVHQAPVRRVVLSVSLAAERRESDRLHHLHIRQIDVLGGVDERAVPVEEDRVHRLIVRRA